MYGEVFAGGGGASLLDVGEYLIFTNDLDSGNIMSRGNVLPYTTSNRLRNLEFLYRNKSSDASMSVYNNSSGATQIYVYGFSGDTITLLSSASVAAGATETVQISGYDYVNMYISAAANRKIIISMS